MRLRFFGLAGLLCVIGAPETRSQGFFSSGGWSGPYFGLTGGGALADVRQSSANRQSPSLIKSGFAGYGIQYSALYLGGEVTGAFGGSKLYHSPSLMAYSLETDWTSSARVRFGWAPTSSILIYATAGPAWSGRTAKLYTLGAGTASVTKKIQGFEIGGGIEVKIAPTITARVEATRVDFGNDRPAFDSIARGSTPINWRSLMGDDTTIRAGISLRLN